MRPATRMISRGERRHGEIVKECLLFTGTVYTETGLHCNLPALVWRPVRNPESGTRNFGLAVPGSRGRRGGPWERFRLPVYGAGFLGAAVLKEYLLASPMKQSPMVFPFTAS
jgi:hypothetical protein